MRYKAGIYASFTVKTSSHNGKVVEVVNYTKGKCKDILLVKIRSHKFYIKEDSLRIASRYDIIRNLSDKQLKRLLN